LIAGQPGSKLQHGPLDVVAVILDVMAVFNVFYYYHCYWPLRVLPKENAWYQWQFSAKDSAPDVTCVQT